MIEAHASEAEASMLVFPLDVGERFARLISYALESTPSHCELLLHFSSNWSHACSLNTA